VAYRLRHRQSGRKRPWRTSPTVQSGISSCSAFLGREQCHSLGSSQAIGNTTNRPCGLRAKASSARTKPTADPVTGALFFCTIAVKFCAGSPWDPLRSQEIGIRLALGAGSSRLRSMVVIQGLRLAPGGRGRPRPRLSG